MVDAREMKKILRNNGYEYQRCKGSHFMYSIHMLHHSIMHLVNVTVMRKKSL